MPYGIPNETPEETKKMESCIAGISGINEKTGKAYTDEEKVAICKSQIMQSRKQLEEKDNGKDKDKTKLQETLDKVVTVVTKLADAVLSSNDLSDWLPILNAVTVKGHKFTVDELKLIASNYNNARKTKQFEAPIILGHTSDGDAWANVVKYENIPAFGYVESLRFNESNGMLEYRIFNQTEKLKNAVKNGFSHTSAEITLKHSNDSVPSPIITAIAVLGANIPAIPEAKIDIAKLENDSETIVVSLNLEENNNNKGENVAENKDTIALSEHEAKLKELEASKKELADLKLKLAESEKQAKRDKIQTIVSDLPEPIKNGLMKLAEASFSSELTEIKLSDSDKSEKPEDIITNLANYMKKNLDIKLANTPDAGEIGEDEICDKRWATVLPKKEK